MNFFPLYNAFFIFGRRASLDTEFFMILFTSFLHFSESILGSQHYSWADINFLQLAKETRQLPGNNKVGTNFNRRKFFITYLSSYDNIVRIYDRHGELLQDPSLPGMCTGLGWDKDGDNLAMISDKSGLVFLWSPNAVKQQQIDSSFRCIENLNLP